MRSPATCGMPGPCDVTTDPRMAPIVSILLPAWNAERTLAIAMRSVLQQTYGKFELIVLDDGSADGTMDIAHSFDDARVKVVHDGRRLGLARRLNQGIDLARGRYIARMDADDVCFPERLARQVDYLERHATVDLLGCRAVVFRNDGDVVGLLPFAGTHEALCARPWRGIPLPHPGWMGRREWFLRHRYRLPEVMRAEDQELLLRSYAESRFACLDDVLLGYRQGFFDLRKTLLARKSLLAAQVRCFMGRGQLPYAAGAVGLTMARVVVDVLATLPRAEGLYFMRMSGSVPKDVVTTLRRSLGQG